MTMRYAQNLRNGSQNGFNLNKSIYKLYSVIRVRNNNTKRMNSTVAHTCSLCNRNFKNAVGLKLHANKMHKQVQEIVNQNRTEMAEQQIEIIDTSSIQNLEEQKEVSPQLQQEIVDNAVIHKNDEVIENITVQKMKDARCKLINCPCVDCTNNQDLDSSFQDNAQMPKETIKMISYPTYVTLPKTSILDVELYGNKMLETSKLGQKCYRDVVFNVFDSPIIENRLIKIENKFNTKQLKLSEIIPNSIPTYLNMDKKINNYQTVLKYSVENNIMFSASNFDPTMISFDIETFFINRQIDVNSIPLPNNGGYISMISAVFQKINEVDIFRIYILESYKYDQKEIENFILERRSQCNVKPTQQFRVIIKQCQNQTIMACAFLDDVRNVGLSILFGFNSSSTIDKDKQQIGYDLPWLIYASGRYTQEQIEFGSKIFGKVGKQIRKINWLPDTYIIDCQVVFQNSRFFSSKLSDMRNRKLNSYLEAINIPLKEDDLDIQQRMSIMRDRTSDMTSTINYCIWDAFALNVIMTKIQFLQTVKANIDIFNIPLSWALTKNPSSWITMQTMREYYKQGFAFRYNKYDMPKDKQKYLGATTEACPETLQLQVLDNICLGDYQSLYPNSQISCNLGPDTVSDQPTENCYKINVNFVDKYLVSEALNKILNNQKLTKQDIKILELDDSPKWVYFDKRPSITVQLIQKGLQQRLDIKAQIQTTTDENEIALLEARQESLKVFINSYYGLGGCCTFQFFDVRVAQATTSVARSLTEIARISIEQLQLGKVVFRDTDSAGILNVQPDLEVIKQQFLNLNQVINQQVKLRFGTDHKFKFISEVNNFQLKTYYPKSKKAYTRLELNLEKPSDLHLKTKGVSWSLMSNYGKLFFQNVCRHILTTCKSHQEIQNFVEHQVSIVRQEIVNLVSTKNWSQLTEKFHKQIKNTQSNQTAIYLRKSFHVISKEIQILPIVKNCKLKSRCVIPANMMCDRYQIDINQLVDWFISPVNKFFGDQYYEQIEYDDLESIMIYKRASQYGYEQKFKEISFDLVEEMIEDKNYSFNEQVQPINKLFFDIDDCYNLTNFYKCLELIEKHICRFQLRKMNVDFAYTKSTDANKPHSYHVVYQILVGRETNKFIAEQVNLEIGFNAIDTGLYALNRTLRLPNSPKYDTTDKKIKHVYHHVVQGSIRDMFISDISNIENRLSDAIGFISIPHKQVARDNTIVTDQHQLFVQQYINVKYTLKHRKDNCYDIIPDIKPFKCLVCQRVHEQQNMKLYTRKSGFTIDCWATQDKTKKQIISHKFESSKLTPKQIRLENIKDLINRRFEYNFKDIARQNITFQNKQEVDYDLDSQCTFVRSQMGTGKTKRQIELLQSNNYQRVLALSFRRTFARDNATKNQLTNYEEDKHRLNLIDNPKLIIQVDSLPKMDLSIMPDLLIVDEVESIIEQLLAIQRDSTPYILMQFIKLIRESPKVLFMDAELETQTVQVLTTIMQTDNYRFFVNRYQPKTQSKIIIHDYTRSQTNKENIQLHLQNLVNQGKNVVVSCTSINLLEQLYTSLQNKQIKTAYYHGNDSKQIEEKGKKMAAIKSDDFKNVSIWKDVQVLLYSGTLTAGISFELDHFDTLIGVFSKQTSTPLSFTQGLHRVRNLKDQELHLYLENESSNEPIIASEITEMKSAIFQGCELSEIQQFTNWIQASYNQNRRQSLQLIIRNLQNMGYQMSLADDSDIDQTQELENPDIIKKLKQLQIEDITKAQITVQDIIDIPKIIKNTQSLINNNDPLLFEKCQKVKLTKSFFQDPDQKAVDKINSYNKHQIQILLHERKRIAESNKIKNAIKKCLDTRPELKDLEPEQMNTLIEAMRLDSKQQIQSQIVDTASKLGISKLSNEIYTIIQAVKLHNKLLQDCSQNSLQKYVEELKENKILKNLGFTFTQNGDHHKLNEILIKADIQIAVDKVKRVRIEGKETRQYTYKLNSITANDIIRMIEDQEYVSKQINKK